jgi:hypothetical protein
MIRCLDLDLTWPLWLQYLIAHRTVVHWQNISSCCIPQEGIHHHDGCKIIPSLHFCPHMHAINNGSYIHTEELEVWPVDHPSLFVLSMPSDPNLAIRNTSEFGPTLGGTQWSLALGQGYLWNDQRCDHGLVDDGDRENGQYKYPTFICILSLMNYG